MPRAAISATPLLRRGPARVLAQGACALLFASPAPGADAAAASGLLQRNLHATAGERLSHALDQFASWTNWVELLVAILLSVGLSLLIAYHPRSVRRRDLIEAETDRKTLVILGVVGAVVSALVLIDQAMALVIFGIGSLIRFRTLIGSPHMTGRAILVVVIGLACGLTQYLTAIVIAGASWAVIWWLNGQRTARVKVRFVPGLDRQKAALVAAESLRRMGCRVQSHKEGASGRSVTFFARVPSTIEDDTLARSLEAALVGEIGRADVEIRG